MIEWSYKKLTLIQHSNINAQIPAFNKVHFHRNFK